MPSPKLMRMVKDLRQIDKKKRATPVGEWTKHMKKQSQKKQTRKANKHMKKHPSSTIIREIQCIQMCIYQTGEGSESWKNMSIGRTVGLQRPLCTAAHGVVGG